MHWAEDIRTTTVVVANKAYYRKLVTRFQIFPTFSRYFFLLFRFFSGNNLIPHKHSLFRAPYLRRCIGTLDIFALASSLLLFASDQDLSFIRF